MNNVGVKNKFIRYYNGYMILGFFCKLNFEGENKIIMYCIINCKSLNIFFIKYMLIYFNVFLSYVVKFF